jgi:hypothetical protein
MKHVMEDLAKKNQDLEENQQEVCEGWIIYACVAGF